MKTRNLSLAILSLTALKTVADKSTVLAQTPESNPPANSPKQNEEDLTPQPLPKVIAPETISNCKFSEQNYQPNELITNSNHEINQDSIPKEIPSNCDSKSANSEAPNTSQESTQEKDPNYIIPPQIVPPERLPPFTTNIPLNGESITHLTEWEAHVDYTLGDNHSSNLDVNGILKIESEVEQSLSKDNLFVSEQRGSYLQLQTVGTYREVELTRTDPQTLQGLIIQ